MDVIQAALAGLYCKDQGVQRDREAALRLTQLAAKENYPRARLNLLQLNAESGQVDSQAIKAALDSLMQSVTRSAPSKQ